MKATTMGVPIQILLAEDNAADVRLVKEVLKDSKVLTEVHSVSDGVEALDFLYRRGKYAQAPRPGILFLDLNMPRKDGREVLSTMKEDPALKDIPVVILTSSQAEEDIVRAYKHHANCYVRKPVDFQQFHDVVRRIENFWFTVVELPGVDGEPKGG
ncbi:MAG: response regulator [Euryarchaeota archaeon]|nr:response regulator [Euryarchaeota archaeon]MDE1835512.1 response regulator [Euryarchaeota archaeon]MDE1879603.1 response regulator [Euryarchaeota archaeon]MDE2043866.1 response regulator [Thermoplasmata archaeon]